MLKHKLERLSATGAEYYILSKVYRTAQKYPTYTSVRTTHTSHGFYLLVARFE